MREGYGSRRGGERVGGTDRERGRGEKEGRVEEEEGGREHDARTIN